MMTLEQARDLAPQWGSLVTNGDPGYIMYTAIPPERIEHRAAMLDHIQTDCMAIAIDNVADAKELESLCQYLESLSYDDNGDYRP